MKGAALTRSCCVAGGSAEAGFADSQHHRVSVSWPAVPYGQTREVGSYTT